MIDTHGRQLHIRQVPQLTQDDVRQLYGWGENIFGTAHLHLTYRAKDPNDLHFLLYAGDEGPLSHAAILKHRASVNGVPALIGGIGGVVTIPSAQRRGYAAMLVRHATEFLAHEWDVDFAMLFCIDRMVSYYARLGWRKVDCEVMLDQPTGKRPSPFHVMTLPFNERFHTINSIDLASASW
jgi:GNAT superfamily N-acetyltransferase